MVHLGPSMRSLRKIESGRVMSCREDITSTKGQSEYPFNIQNKCSYILGIGHFINTTIIYFRILYPLRDFPATAKVRVTTVIIHAHVHAYITYVHHTNTHIHIA